MVRLPGHFAGLFAGRIYVWERTLLLILLPCTSHSHSCERLHRLVPRGKLYLSSVLSVPLTSPRTCEACRVEAASSQPVHARIRANIGKTTEPERATSQLPTKRIRGSSCIHASRQPWRIPQLVSELSATFQGGRQHCVGSVRTRKLENLGRAVLAQVAIVRRRARRSTVTDARERTKALEESDKKNTLFGERTQ